MREIKTDTLEIILKNVINSLRKRDIEVLSFEEAWYYHVPDDQLTLLTEDPSLTIGSLNDDIDFLNSIVEEDYVTDLLELKRLASLFRFLSKKVSG